MSPREFEEYCENLIRESLDMNLYNLKYQRRKVYPSIGLTIMDFYISEKRQGGRSWVIECKHYQTAVLGQAQLRRAEEYRKRSKSSGAIMLISKGSNQTNIFQNQADELGIPVIEVDIGWKSKVHLLRKFLVAKLDLELYF